MSAQIRQRLESLAMGGINVDIGAAWIACDYPERPPDKDVMYHVMPRCHGCDVAEEAANRRAAGPLTEGDAPG